MIDGLDSNKSSKLKSLRKYVELGASRWEVTLFSIFSIFFFVVIFLILDGSERFDWITWVDAMQTSLLFYILAVVTKLHYKLLGPKIGD